MVAATLVALEPAALQSVIDALSVSVVILDVEPDGGFRYVASNDVHGEFAGMPDRAFVGRRVEESRPTAAAAASIASWRRAVATRAPVDFDACLAMPGGPTVWRGRAVPVTDPASGRVVRVVCSYVEVGGERGLRASQTIDRRRLDLIARVARITFGDLNLATGGVEQDIELAALLGLPGDAGPSDARRHAEQIHPEDRRRLRALIRRARARRIGWDTTIRVVEPGGGWRHLRTVYEPAPDDPTRLVGIAVDLAAESAAGLETILDGQLERIVRFLPDGTILYVNEAYARMLGRTKRELVGTNILRDVPVGLHRALRRELAGLRAERPRLEYRLEVDRRSRPRVEDWAIHAVFGADGQPREYQAVGRDMTEPVRAQERLRQSEERYRALVESSPDAVWIIQQGRWVFANPAAAELLAAPGIHKLVGLPVGARAADEISREVELRLGRLENADGSRYDGEIALRRFDERIVEVAIVARPIVYDGGAAVQVAARDVTERAAALREIEHLALHDTLTGLANRLLFRRELEAACARARRNGTHVAVISIDLDGFKQVNDRLGHSAGDAILVQVAARLQADVRETDLVARLGGDEFAIVSPDHETPSGPTLLIERLRALFRHPFTFGEHAVAVGASVGVALLPTDADDIDSLMSRADQAMYGVKRRQPRAFGRRPS